ncbi:uncharacterized protein LOC142772306 [Rhipicephalus microplus]|uniref:uncharacterized protein LOC142772306 n=1 Tax=Rhipicephalus microplus TaxID=6941 RepID=UPI003F6AFB49
MVMYCGRYGFLPATATVIVLTACLLAALAYSIKAEERAPEAVPLSLNASALRAGDDCPCRRGALPGDTHAVTLKHSRKNATKNVVQVTTPNAVSMKRHHRIDSHGKSSATRPRKPKAASLATPSDSVGRVVPVNPALHGVGDPSPPSLVPE